MQAAPGFDLSGYIVDLPAYQRFNPGLSSLFGVPRDQFLNSMRLRLRPTLELWTGGSFALEYEADFLYHSASLPLQNIQALRRQTFDWHWRSASAKHWMITHFVDRLYFRQNFDAAHLIIGRQRIAWGTGRVWNPTDLFNPINPAVFDKVEKDGADAIAFKYYLGNFTDVELVYNVENEFNDRNAGARIRTNFAEFDVSITSGSFDRRFVLGGDFAGNLFDAGVRGEVLYSGTQDGIQESYLRFILGADYQFTPDLYCMTEYQFNGEGTSDKTQYEILRLITGRIINVGRDYLFLSSSYLVHPLVTASLGLNLNLNDKSGFISPSIGYSTSENSSLSAGGILSFGGEGSEYWYYPLSIYLRGEVYF